ncbi:MAG: hypothetical protein ACR2PF_19430 [Rhizobiaceae bacterium]
MYAGDSYFTLTSGGQVLIGSISMLLALACVAVCAKLAWRRPWPARLIAALAVFVFFVWLSPQVYYTCYIFLWDVSWQIVIGIPPSPEDVLRILTFTNRANLSFHSQGLLGWLLIATALLLPRLCPLSAKGRSVVNMDTKS